MQVSPLRSWHRLLANLQVACEVGQQEYVAFGSSATLQINFILSTQAYLSYLAALG